MAHQGKGQLMLPRDPPALARQNRLISKRTPAALTCHPKQQRWMGLYALTRGSCPFKTQPHYPVFTSSTGGYAMAWLMRKQGNK